MTIKEINDAIDRTFTDSEALDVDYVYEKEGENYKLVVFFNKLYMEEAKVLYTKVIFPVDSEKVNLLKQSFLYLYDINCLYRNVDFDDIYDFVEKIKSIIENEKFGKSIKNLSNFMENPSFSVNEWLQKENVDLSTTIKYSPKVTIIPCKYISFDFNININNIDVELIITKDGKDDFRYEFKYPNDTDRISKQDLSDIVETIGLSLKNNIL